MNSLHITITNCCNESRLLKHCELISKLGSVDEVYVVALASDGLSASETQGAEKVRRFHLKSRGWSKALFTQLLKCLGFVIRVLKEFRAKNVGIVVVHSLGLLPLGFSANSASEQSSFIKLMS